MSPLAQKVKVRCRECSTAQPPQSFDGRPSPNLVHYTLACGHRDALLTTAHDAVRVRTLRDLKRLLFREFCDRQRGLRV